jgi:hypothetical protein
MSQHDCSPEAVGQLQLAEELSRQRASTARLQKQLAELEGDDLAALVAGNTTAAAELEAVRYGDEATELLRGACRKCELAKTCAVSMCKGE